MVRKIIFSLILIFCFVNLVCVGYLWINRVSLASRYLSRNMEANVTFSELSINLDRLAFENIRIHQQKEGILFTAKTLEITFRFSDLLRRETTIEKISIQNGKMRLKIDLPDEKTLFSAGKSVQDIFKKATGLKVFQSKEPKPSLTNEKKILIRSLVATNFRLELITPLLLKKELSFPAVPLIELHNVRNNATSTAQGIAKLVFQSLLSKMGQYTPELGLGIF